MKKVVTKFGGSSLADANQIKKVKDIILSNTDRRYVVVSASGKRHKDDDKITDLLLSHFDSKDNETSKKDIEDKLFARYKEIVKELKIDFDVEKELKNIFENAKNKKTADYIASRGEYLSAKILSLYMGGAFLDMQGVIIFNDDKKLNYELTYANVSKKINEINSDHIIIPGFYGSDINGDIITFSRGGSDITGSIVARAINADIYENWTDVSGVMFVDPRIAENVKPIEYITYTELRELSYMGATVLHEATIYPVSKVGIPIHILNTNNPIDKGTMIVANIPSIVKRGVVTGVAGRKGFTAILLQKALMNEEVGYLARLLDIFKKENISVEHCPTGIDTISIVIKSELLNGKKDKVLNAINKELNPDVLNVEDNISLIAVVGEGMIYHKDVITKIFKTLSDVDVAVKMIDQGSSGINVIIGVSDDDYDKSMKALSTLQNI